MPINSTTLDQIELDLETAHAQFAEGLIDPLVTGDTKLLAAAITLAGSEIAVAIAGAGRSENGSVGGSAANGG
jgi:hypothetical protein